MFSHSPVLCFTVFVLILSAFVVLQSLCMTSLLYFSGSPRNKERHRLLMWSSVKKRGRKVGRYQVCFGLFKSELIFFFLITPRRLGRLGREQQWRGVKLFRARSFTITRKELMLSPWLEHRVSAMLWWFWFKVWDHWKLTHTPGNRMTGV